MLRTIHLHGALAEQFQPFYALAIETPAEAVRALSVQLPGFESEIRRGEFVCIRGSLDHGLECDEDLFRLNLGSVRDFHIIPVAVGAGHGGGTKILLGIAMIGTAFVTGGASIIAQAGAAGSLMGAGAAAGVIGGAFSGALGVGAALSAWTAGIGALLLVGGIARALTPTPQGNTSSYSFNGAINTSQQGSGCPLVFGRLLAGSVTVSAGVDSEALPSNEIGANIDQNNANSQHYGDVTQSEGVEGVLSSSQTTNPATNSNPTIISTTTLAGLLANSNKSSS